MYTFLNFMNESASPLFGVVSQKKKKNRCLKCMNLDYYLTLIVINNKLIIFIH